MKNQTLWGILFFSALWGISEVFVGGMLYSAHIAHASVILTVIAFVILTFARVYLPFRGIATLIAVLTMLYKFMFTPQFACHMLGILFTGLCYDLCFSGRKSLNKSLCAVCAVYLSYAAFALTITYLFRYDHWAQASLTKVLSYIGISGSITAAACAVLVPLSFTAAKKLKARFAASFGLPLRLATPGISMTATLVWLTGMVVYFVRL